MSQVQLTGVGASVPSVVVTNDDLAAILETSDEWIRTRTGIRERRILPPDQSLVDLALPAAQQALAMAAVEACDLDLIILATSTGADRFGSAPQIQARLGATRALAFDLGAACSGFVYGIATAAQFIQAGTYRRVLVIAADVLSRTVDWSDRSTCVLFGDGAGAMVLEAAETPGLLALELRADGAGSGLLTLANTVEATPLTDTVQVGNYLPQPIRMNGREVYKFAVKSVPEVIEKVLFRCDLVPHAIDAYFLHQANQRIIEAIADRLQVPLAHFASVLDRYGNTSGASVAIAIADWVESGQLHNGQHGVMAGFGAGLTWGAIVFRWGRLN